MRLILSALTILNLVSTTCNAEDLKGFTDALQASIRHNPQIQGKLAEINAQQANVESAKAGRYPSIFAEVNDVNSDIMRGLLTIKQPLWSFGKIDGAISQAEARFNVEQLALLQVQRQLIENTAVTYSQIEGLRNQVEVHRLNIEEHDKLYQRIKRRAEGRLASEADVRLAYSRLTRAKLNLERELGKLVIAESDLQILTQKWVKSEQAVDRQHAHLPVMRELLIRGRNQHADLLYKRALVKSSSFAIDQQRAAAMPTVSFQIEQEFLDTVEGADHLRAGLVINGTLDGLGVSSYSKIKSVKAQYNAVKQDVDVTRNEVKRRITSLMLNRQTQQNLRKSQIETVEALEQTMASFLRQYETSRKSWVEVLNNQRELTEMRLALAQIDNDWLTYSLRVKAISGGLDSAAGLIPEFTTPN